MEHKPYDDEPICIWCKHQVKNWEETCTEFDRLNKAREYDRNEVKQMISKADHMRARRWILSLPMTEGIPLVSYEMRYDLVDLLAYTILLEEKIEKMKKKGIKK